MNSTYFMIPLADVPATPSYQLWYAVKEPPDLTWTTERPALTSETESTWVVGVVTNDEVPKSATFAWPNGTKTTQPPRMTIEPGTSIEDFQTQFNSCLSVRG